MTKDEFVERFAEQSGYTKEEILEHMVPMHCRCGAEACKGWAMVYNNPFAVQAHQELYGIKEDEQPS